MANSAEGPVQAVFSASIQGISHIQYPVRILLKIRSVIKDLLTQRLLGICGKDEQARQFIFDARFEFLGWNVCVW